MTFQNHMANWYCLVTSYNIVTYCMTMIQDIESLRDLHPRKKNGLQYACAKAFSPGHALLLMMAFLDQCEKRFLICSSNGILDCSMVHDLLIKSNPL